MRLFADQFFAPAEPARVEGGQPVYDEARSLNLDLAGRVFVERDGTATRTATITEVDAEAEDRDPDDEPLAFLGTDTKAMGEATDHTPSEILLGTDTKKAPDPEDRGPDAALTSMEALLGTETRVIGETADRVDVGGWAGTKTFVADEADDFHADVMD